MKSSAESAATRTICVFCEAWKPCELIKVVEMLRLLIIVSFQRFPMATKEDLDANDDDCAVCWEKMETARKLPCSHLFHK
jgi:hypothetical protein